MSVLSRHRTIPAHGTIPTQRVGETVIDLDTPAPQRPAAPRPAPPSAPPRGSQRTALLLAGGAVIVAATVGTGVYVALDDGGDTFTNPATPAEIQSENRRDANASARDRTAATESEAQRDANASLRGGVQP